MERKLTCIICPLGCQLTAFLDGTAVTAVEGNTCPRGKEYAENECTNPQRTVTSTVRCADGSLVSVKTDRPIPKDKVSDCMVLINKAVAKLPIAIGDVILDDVFGSKIVATQNKKAAE